MEIPLLARPKRGETDEELLRMQDDFLKSGGKPSVEVVRSSKNRDSPERDESELPIRPSEAAQRWLHMDQVEEEKLEWMTMLPPAKEPDSKDPVVGRFDFEGNLVSPSAEIPTHRGLHHHGDSPQHWEGRYAGLLAETDLADHLLGSGLAPLLRSALDDRSTLDAALAALRALVVSRPQEEVLKRAFLWCLGHRSPFLQPVKSVEGTNELTDLELSQADIIKLWCPARWPRLTGAPCGLRWNLSDFWQLPDAPLQSLCASRLPGSDCLCLALEAVRTWRVLLAYELAGGLCLALFPVVARRLQLCSCFELDGEAFDLEYGACLLHCLATLPAEVAREAAHGLGSILESCCGRWADWLARSDHAEASGPLQNKDDTLLWHQVSLTLVGSCAPGFEDRVFSLLLSVVFRPEFARAEDTSKPGESATGIDACETLTSVTGSPILMPADPCDDQQLAAVRNIYLDAVRQQFPKRELQALSLNWAEHPVLPLDWPYLPLEALCAEDVIPGACSLHGVLGCLRWVAFLLRQRPQVLATVPPLVHYCRLASVFLAGPDVFLDAEVQGLLLLVLRLLRRRKLLCATQKDLDLRSWPGLLPFSDL
ncbi:hypothetical protein IscW_ISCW018291 [Ixodes scapularis]|uniref:Uncharacterized protein n=1 Tax=Ixodes scapularis TaxID=6945 RepID=B7PHG7_IXOSC|nr:hypothetical protein IscW_ISCW018291 [Ixodes scapularis]|eukprot:XP_002402793.1 hypothetical protein IscW_ISCW018291 [Ixodes scapularis]